MHVMSTVYYHIRFAICQNFENIGLEQIEKL